MDPVGGPGGRELQAEPSARSRLRMFRMFSSSAQAPRQRRPSDVAGLVGGLAVLLWMAANAPGPTDVDLAVEAVLDDLTGVLGWLWEVGYLLLSAWVVILIVAPVVRHGQGRLRLLVDYALALVCSSALAIGVGALSGTPLDDAVVGLASAEPPPVYPAVRLALATAVIVTASPHVTRPFTVAGRIVLPLGAMAAIGLHVAHPSGVVAGWAVGAAAASFVHLLLGSPGGQLTAEQVHQALLDLGISTLSVLPGSPREPGEQLLRAHGADGQSLEVKVFSRDAWDAQLVGSLWSALTRRGEALRLAGSRRERVEHEAMMALLAERAGVPVLPVVASGLGAEGEALVIAQAPARECADLPPGSAADPWLTGAWSALAALHTAGLAHRRITARHVVERADGTTALADFAHARLAATGQELMIDRVHLLVTLALSVGPRHALDSAVAALGVDGVAETLPYIQDPVLSPSLRRELGTDWGVEDLRALAIERTGAQAAPLAELRRVTGAALLKLLLGGVAVYSLVGLLAGVDLDEVLDTLASADVLLLVVGTMVAPLAQVSFTFSTLGASMQRLPYLPVLMLQYAIQFIALVLPATAARVGLQIRFFERLGISYGAATSMGAIDGGGGFVVQVLLLVLLAASALPGATGTATTGTDSSEESSDPSLLAMAVLIGLIWAAWTLAIPRRRARLRREIPRFLAAMRAEASQARSSLVVLRHPGKVAGVLGGNLGGQLVQALVLGICLTAFGESASLSQLILVNTCVSLFAGLMPVPGGVGVAEAGYTYGLQAIGVPSAIAVATALAFRLVTFYLPPLWCSQAMRWLRRNAYV